jgi:hypothetical protein
MEDIPPELFPIQAWNGEGPPELKSEDLLLIQMSQGPMIASAARAYANRKYLMYFFIAVSFIGLPLAVFGATYLNQLGFPLWLSQVGIVITLGGFFIFFFGMIILIASRSKVLKHLGIRPVEEGRSKVSDDVAMLAERHGRVLEYGIEGTENFWRHASRLPVFRIEYWNKQFYASSGLPSSIRSVLERLPPNTLWRKLRIDGGPEGIRSSRPIRLAKYFIQDLWLLEGILNANENKR